MERVYDSGTSSSTAYAEETHPSEKEGGEIAHSQHEEEHKHLRTRITKKALHGSVSFIAGVP
jgi:hypothetical protein